MHTYSSEVKTGQKHKTLIRSRNFSEAYNKVQAQIK